MSSYRKCDPVATQPSYYIMKYQHTLKLKHANIEYAEMWGIREAEQYPALGFKMICMT